MKKIYTTLVLLALAVISFSQPFYIYTAKRSGFWYTGGNWTIQLRTDGVKKNKVVIPKTFTILIDNNVNRMGLGDVEINVFGILIMAPNTTLNLSNNSSIQLLDGTLSGNAANQRIFIGGVLKYKGNIDGEKTEFSIADKTTGTAPDGFREFSILPVNLTSFYINKSGQNIQLTWSTDKEMNNSHFEVERSFNGINWEKIAIIFGAGNSSSTNNYSYNDKNISSPVVYYRLRQVDIDGRSAYSSIKTIRIGETISAVKIYGFEKTVVIDINSSIKSNIIVSVINNSGQVVSQKTYSNPSYKITLNLHHIPTGAYIVRVVDNKGVSEVKKVIL